MLIIYGKRGSKINARKGVRNIRLLTVGDLLMVLEASQVIEKGITCLRDRACNFGGFPFGSSRLGTKAFTIVKKLPSAVKELNLKVERKTLLFIANTVD